jgi:hypothetical protein
MSLTSSVQPNFLPSRFHGREFYQLVPRQHPRHSSIRMSHDARSRKCCSGLILVSRLSMAPYRTRMEGLALPTSCPISRRYVIFCATGKNHRHYENETCKDPRFIFLPSCLAGTRDGPKQGENENVGQALDRRLR